MKVLDIVIVHCDNCECNEEQRVARITKLGSGIIKHQFICGVCQAYNYKYEKED